jgi:phosphonatase-like hydrolase
MSTIELVVFDIAGTTVRDNGSVAKAFIEAFRDFGFEMPNEDVRKVMGFRKIEAIALLMGKLYPRQKDDEVLIDRIHTRFIDKMISLYRNDDHLAPFAHTEQVFSALKQRGIRIALNTGFTRSIADTILHRLRWDDRSSLIDKVICSDEVTHGRPYPDMIAVLIDELGITSPDRVLKVGDTEVDVEEGRNAGCGKVVGVTTGANTREQLESYHPDYIIDDLEELLPIIEKA